jgi:hypothetical protein
MLPPLALFNFMQVAIRHTNPSPFETDELAPLERQSYCSRLGTSTGVISLMGRNQGLYCLGYVYSLTEWPHVRYKRASGIYLQQTE